MIVVTDNGALGHLILIEQAELLPRLHHRVLIPPAVVWEFKDPETPEEVRRWIATRPQWAEVVAPAGEPDRIQPGAGEREAHRLAKEYDAVLLCDDKRAVSADGEKVYSLLEPSESWCKLTEIVGSRLNKK